MNIVKSTDILVNFNSKGGQKFWQGHVCEKNGIYSTFTTYWSTLKDQVISGDVENWEELQGTSISKITKSELTEIIPKNIGKANETSPKEQAISEITSSYNKQLDKGYYIYGAEKPVKLTLPMLAQSFGDKSHKVTFPVVCQPKFDGCRALSDGKMMWSRMGKVFDNGIIGHLVEKLGNLDYVLDGELILPPGYPLQDTVSAVKKQNELSPKLMYRVYDLVVDLSYTERYEMLKEIVQKINSPQIVLAPVYLAETVEEIHDHHETLVKEGWEGTMIRLCGHGYKTGQRHVQLLKLKDFMEEEFKVISVSQGVGKFAGAATFTCETPEGKTFEATPIGTMEVRREYFSNPSLVVGKNWTIRFQAYTKDKIPQFPRAICERVLEIQG